MSRNALCLTLVFLVISLSTTAFADTFVVNTTDDSGVGSLRQAILNANANPGADDIAFQIPPSGFRYDPEHNVWKLYPETELPVITDAVVIDGSTQGESSVGGPSVLIDGSSAGDDADGFCIQSSDVTIRGIVIGDFNSGNGINIENPDQQPVSNITIVGCFIGTDWSGRYPHRNGCGIYAWADYYEWFSNITIGGYEDADRNVISGNGGAIGIHFVTDILIAGNHIGVDRDGSSMLSNGSGIHFGSVDELVIVKNVISGNETKALNQFTGCEDVFVIENLIGTDASGTFGLGNGTGYSSMSGSIIIRFFGNVISGNETGIRQEKDTTLMLAGNYIGTDITGSYAIPNQVAYLNSRYEASTVMMAPAEGYGGNIISGNDIGIEVLARERLHFEFRGNLVGVAADGATPIPNRIGLVVSTQANSYGMIQIGGPDEEDRNILSGNLEDGLQISWLFDHSWSGIPEEPLNLVQGNAIGVGIDGITPVPNGRDGIRIWQGGFETPRTGSIIEGNHIAYNAGNGITVLDDLTYANEFRSNRIHDNGGLGIDLGDDGPTAGACDGASGPNRLLAMPVIDLFHYDTETNMVRLEGTACPDAEVELFISSSQNSSGYGEGEEPFGTQSADATGAFATWISLPSVVGQNISATQTIPDPEYPDFGNTSEFSLASPLSWDSCEVFTITPDNASEDSTVTVTITGENMPMGGTSVFLGLGDDMYEGEITLQPEPTWLQAKFDLPDGSAGMYAVMVVTPCSNCQLDDAFEITSGSPCGASSGSDASQAASNGLVFLLLVGSAFLGWFRRLRS